MKKKIITLGLLLESLTMSAQDIQLPQPNMTQQSMSVVEALNTRHSVRKFDTTKELTNQELSNLCWAAFGMTRDDNHRTAPTAMNRQEIRLFAFTKTAVYEYEAKTNTLVKKADGDHRDLLAGGGAKPANGKGGFRQEFVMDAPVSLMMVIDYDIFGKQDEKAVMMGCVDAGNVSENVNLYCQAVGLATVPRATMDVEGIRTLLGFTEKQLPIMNNPVGYEKVAEMNSKNEVKERKPVMTGGYTEGHAVSQDELKLFNKTYKKKPALTPVSVATQVVAGTNYRFICKDKSGNRYEVVIYENLPCNGGKCEVTSVEKLTE